MTESKWSTLFKLIGNSFNEHCLPFTISNQHYFQNQYRYHSISFCSVHFLSIILAIKIRSSLRSQDDHQIKIQNILLKRMNYKIYLIRLFRIQRNHND